MRYVVTRAQLTKKKRDTRRWAAWCSIGGGMISRATLSDLALYVALDEDTYADPAKSAW